MKKTLKNDMINATRPSLPVESFSYDKVGNRLTSADASNWTYNQNNALIGYDGVNYMYDPNGNTTSKNESGQITNYLYNAKNRLTQVNLPNGHIATYLYDPFGRRISKTVDGTTTYFMYSDEGLIAEMDSSGNVQKTYGWKPGGTWGTNPVLMTSNGQTYFYHNDHLGTPQKMTDSTGKIVWSAVYTSFGEATIDGTSTITNNLRFPGQYYDAETGLNYNWNRYYDPIIGRYLTADPIGLMGGPNTYRYSSNNPSRFYDYEGLDTNCTSCHKTAQQRDEELQKENEEEEKQLEALADAMSKTCAAGKVGKCNLEWENAKNACFRDHNNPDNPLELQECVHEADAKMSGCLAGARQ